MTLKGPEFFSADVSEGFFNHHVTSIEPCGSITAFASANAMEPVIGWADAKSKGFWLAKRYLQETAGIVTALGCINNAEIFIGTSTGELIRFDGSETEILYRFEGQAVTAITFSAELGLPATEVQA